MRASAAEKCQSTLAWCLLRSSSQAATSLVKVCLSGIRRSRHCEDRTLRVGETAVQQHNTETAKPTAMSPATPIVPVVVGLDGGYVRSRHRQVERHFEVIAGKVIDADGSQHRFAFARNSQAASAEAFAQALGAAGVHADTPATVPCDDDAGLWRLQRETCLGQVQANCGDRLYLQLLWWVLRSPELATASGSEGPSTTSPH
jgi:hypothetical protein